MRLDTLELHLVVIRFAKGILRAWEDWVRRRMREPQNPTQN